MSDGRGGSPERIGALVEGLLRSRGLAEGVERAAVFPEWAELVGPQIAQVATPVGFDRSTLFVEVRSKFERIVFRLAPDG
jgi:hypothetical protein